MKEVISPMMAEALMCLALNVYFEARSENMASQMAVSLVVMNRVEDHRFPNTVCGVVKQGLRYKNDKVVLGNASSVGTVMASLIDLRINRHG